MLDYLSPNFYFKSYGEITPEFLKQNNIDTLLFDIDNTLAPYEQAKPDEALMTYFKSLRENGIKFAFVSNNSSDERIKVFNENIGVPAFAKSAKPFASKNINKALNLLSSKKDRAAFVGDQIFTDVCAGKFYGMRAILVPPIKDKTSLFFKFKRALEKPVLNHYFKKNGINI